MNPSIVSILAKEFSMSEARVTAVIGLVEDGATIPFIACYRKEVTANMDSKQLRNLNSRWSILKEVEYHSASIFKTIEELGKSTPQLKQRLTDTTSLIELEDIYLSFRSKDSHQLTVARRAGLQKLADQILQQPTLNPKQIAIEFIKEDSVFSDEDSCLEGAKEILIEYFSVDADLLKKLRVRHWQSAIIQSRRKRSRLKKVSTKFQDFDQYEEPINQISAQRLLMLFRGRAEGCLSLSLLPETERLKKTTMPSSYENIIAEHFSINTNQEFAPWLSTIIKEVWIKRLKPYLDKAAFKTLKDNADRQMITLYAENLKDILMMPPASSRVVMGLDPALRSGVKVAIVGMKGQLIAHTIVFPHTPQNQWSQSLRKIEKLCAMYKVSLIAIGHGPGSRETERLVKELIKETASTVGEYRMINDSAASIYSASKLANVEFPDLDMGNITAISIARRLQDPLIELVKINPKYITVGPFQHEVNQYRLSQRLMEVVEDCVNTVGVDVNRSCVKVLSNVSGISAAIAENIVAMRHKKGAFYHRRQLLEIPRLNEKVYQQCAGFLRINKGSNVLDNSAIHPEAYSIVDEIVIQLQNKPLSEILGNRELLATVNAKLLISDAFAMLTVRDILKELEKPGSDPRPEFSTLSYREDVLSIDDVQVGMKLQGVISNVTSFGAFVDVGIQQDGLIHISSLSGSFVSDPKNLIKKGEVVTVWVLSVDPDRHRISFSLISPAEVVATTAKHNGTSHNISGTKSSRPRIKKPVVSDFANALSRALLDSKSSK